MVKEIIIKVIANPIQMARILIIIIPKETHQTITAITKIGRKIRKEDLTSIKSAQIIPNIFNLPFINTFYFKKQNKI